MIKEAPRFDESLVETPRPEAHIHRFAQWYAGRISRPHTFVTPQGVLSFDPDPDDAEVRSFLLSDYLKSPPPTRSYSWGRTVFAEVRSWQMMKTILKPVLEAYGWFMEFGNDALDNSHYGENYQKGADLYIAKFDKETGAAEPIVGIDVTIGNNDIVKNKRRGPGFQSSAAMPVVVFPLTDFGINGYHNKRYWHLLDRQARDAVVQGVPSDAFWGFSQKDIDKWRAYLGGCLQEGIEKCFESIDRDKNGKASNYPHLDTVLGKLNQVEDMVHDFHCVSGAVQEVEWVE